MKKLAAQDFEDVLQVSSVCVVSFLTLHILCQCCIPCFEGLLPAPHNNSVIKLLYLAVYWHSIAKLRMHSETTLKILDNVTVLFAKALQHFKEVTCPQFNTVETDCKYAARRRAAERRIARRRADIEQSATSTSVMTPPMVGPTWPRVRSTLGSDYLPALSQGTSLLRLDCGLTSYYLHCYRTHPMSRDWGCTSMSFPYLSMRP